MTGFPVARPRRNRRSAPLRKLVCETRLGVEDLVWPCFVREGGGPPEAIDALPGCHRYAIPDLVAAAGEAAGLGIRALALFPVVPESVKDSQARAASDPDGLVPRTVRALKVALPDLLVITDVALDPYSSDGHDGVVVDGLVDNDATLPLLAAMAVTQAAAGADIVAPSDMMDGRVGALRRALDAAGHTETAICSYAAKYASAFYGPFRAALDSAPRHGDKRSYQMDPGNRREAIREVALDEAEGADLVLIKPGLPYLDVVSVVRAHTALPVAAYHVSGEYAMLRAAAAKGWLDYQAGLLESLLAFRRAGADLVFTYGAVDAARFLHSE